MFPSSPGKRPKTDPSVQHIAAVLFLALAASPLAAAATKPVRVFILAGQSNMEGAGRIKADPKRNSGKGDAAIAVAPTILGRCFVGEAMGRALCQLIEGTPDSRNNP